MTLTTTQPDGWHTLSIQLTFRHLWAPLLEGLIDRFQKSLQFLDALVAVSCLDVLHRV
jgi:hypothetical protein